MKLDVIYDAYWYSNNYLTLQLKNYKYYCLTMR